jgi:hypothetical protein
MRPTAFASCLVVLLVVSHGTQADSHRGQQAAAPPGAARIEVTEDAVDMAIEKAKRFLLSRQGKDGAWLSPIGIDADAHAETAMAAHALQQAGGWHRGAVQKAFAWFDAHRTRSLRHLAMRHLALGVAWYRRGRSKGELVTDVERFKKAFRGGADPGKLGGEDGYWAFLAAEQLPRYLRPRIPVKAWQALRKDWTRGQDADGGWGRPLTRGSNVPMTAEGVWSLWTSHNRLQHHDHRGVGQVKPIEPVQRGLDWLGAHFDDLLAGRLRGGRDLPQCLFHLLQAARATGQWHLGGKELFRAGTAVLLRSQRPDGGWEGGSRILSTAYALCFLVEGSRPVFLTHLQYDGDWNNRPDAVASLTAWMGERLCEPLPGWETLAVGRPLSAWSDARVLLITGSRAPRFAAAQLDKLRTFVRRGGAIFSCTEGRGQGFRQGVRQVYANLFPQHRLAACDPDHRVYTIHHKIRRAPALHEVSNGVRPLAIHCDDDLPLAWQMRTSLRQPEKFRLAANAYLYLTGRAWFRSYRRGMSAWPAAPAFRPKRIVTMARVQHAGNCDPEPLAWERFGRLMGHRLQVQVNCAGPLPAARLAAAGVDLAMLSGTADPRLRPAEQAALKQYVAGGGTLLVEAAGGAEPFAKAVKPMLKKLFAPDALQDVPVDHPLYRIKGLEIDRLEYTAAARLKGRGPQGPWLTGIVIDGRLAVIYSSEDITTALLGRHWRTFAGHEPESAFAVLRNVLLHAAGVEEKP